MVNDLINGSTKFALNYTPTMNWHLAMSNGTVSSNIDFSPTGHIVVDIEQTYVQDENITQYINGASTQLRRVVATRIAILLRLPPPSTGVNSTMVVEMRRSIWLGESFHPDFLLHEGGERNLDILWNWNSNQFGDHLQLSSFEVKVQGWMDHPVKRRMPLLQLMQSLHGTESKKDIESDIIPRHDCSSFANCETNARVKILVAKFLG